MHVASLELCRQLYELSGWHGTNSYFSLYFERGEEVPGEETLVHRPGKPLTTDYFNRTNVLPAYDLGYLMRKLPGVIMPGNGREYKLHIYSTPGGTVIANYLDIKISKDFKEYNYIDVLVKIDWVCDTPEDYLVKLAIHLIKEGLIEVEKEGKS